MVIWLNKFSCLILFLSENKSSYDIYVRTYFVNFMAKILIGTFTQILVKALGMWKIVQIT